jgi:hypothetical protein
VNSTIGDPRPRNLLQSRSARDTCDVENASRQNYRRTKTTVFEPRGIVAAQKKTARIANDTRRILFRATNVPVESD